MSRITTKFIKDFAVIRSDRMYMWRPNPISPWSWNSTKRQVDCNLDLKSGWNKIIWWLSNNQKIFDHENYVLKSNFQAILGLFYSDFFVQKTKTIITFSLVPKSKTTTYLKYLNSLFFIYIFLSRNYENILKLGSISYKTADLMMYTTVRLFQ